MLPPRNKHKLSRRSSLHGLLCISTYLWCLDRTGIPACRVCQNIHPVSPTVAMIHKLAPPTVLAGVRLKTDQFGRSPVMLRRAAMSHPAGITGVFSVTRCLQQGLLQQGSFLAGEDSCFSYCGFRPFCSPLPRTWFGTPEPIRAEYFVW